MQDAGARATALVAATTANVLDKTEKMLVSLAACRDRFELLVRPCPECHLQCLLWQRQPTTASSRQSKTPIEAKQQYSSDAVRDAEGRH